MEPLIPPWIQVFVVAGIAVLTVLVPLKVLYEMTRTSRERTRKAKELAERLKERLGQASYEGGFLVPPRIRVSFEGRTAVLTPEDEDELRIVLHATVAPVFPLVVRTKGALGLPFAVEGWRLLPRLRTFDPLLDESIAVYADGVFGAYVRDVALDVLPAGGKAAGLAESLIVLRRLPGVRAFELRMSASGGVRLRFELRSGDLLYRPDELESVLHHAFAIYDRLVRS
jgi:hypothetical protein